MGEFGLSFSLKRAVGITAIKQKISKALQAEVNALKAELEKTKKALADALKQKEDSKPAPPKQKTMKDGHEYVDLGLPSGKKWATCNVGANSPEDYGDYFAWGETNTKAEYTVENSLTDGLTMTQLRAQGYVDGSFSLTPQHDAATANWGGSWRMPTEDELWELVDHCEWEWTEVNGVNGSRVIGPNGSCIFLPAASYRYGTSLGNDGYYGYYWSSTPDDFDDNAFYLYFNNGGEDVDYGLRVYGQAVRPITE